MKKNKFLIGLSLSAACLVGLASCQGAQGPKGDQGNPGINGTNGTDGKPGEDGKDGNQVRTGKGIPETSLGIDGDSYIDTLTSDFYYKQNGEWVKTGNLKGDIGDTGSTGEDGTLLHTGNGEPSKSLGSEGDSYIDLSTFDFYVKENGTWTKTGNLKGDKGEAGEKGDKGTSGSSGSKGQDGLNGSPAYSNTILYSENGYVTVDVGSATVDSEITFTMHPLSSSYTASLLELTSGTTTTQYSVDSNASNKLVLNDEGYYSTKVKMVEGGYVVKGTFKVNTQHVAEITNDNTSGKVTFDRDNKTYYVGEKVTLSIAPTSDDYKLESITLNGEEKVSDIKDNKLTTFMPDNGLSVVTTWKYTGKSSLSITKPTNGSVEVYLGDTKQTGEEIDGAYKYEFDSSTNIKIKFIPASEYLLDSYQFADKDKVDCSTVEVDETDNSYTIDYSITKISDSLTVSFKSTDTLCTITNEDEFYAFMNRIGVEKWAKFYNGKTITVDKTQLTSIDMKDKTWTPVNYTFDNYSFTFKGNGLTISNFSVKRLTENGIDIGTNVGLFGELRNCSISGLNFNKANIQGHVNVGILAGNTKNVQIDGCEIISSKVYANSEYKKYYGQKAGLFVGYDMSDDTNKKSSITNCVISGSCEVKSAYTRGGFVGHIEEFDKLEDYYEFKNNVIKDNSDQSEKTLKVVIDTNNDWYKTEGKNSHGYFLGCENLIKSIVGDDLCNKIYANNSGKDNAVLQNS